MPLRAAIRDFALALRTLRLEQDSPTYDALARSTGLSRSTVADAFGGVRLPSERTVHGLASALGARPEEWVARRAAIVAAAREEVSSPASQATAEELDAALAPEAETGEAVGSPVSHSDAPLAEGITPSDADATQAAGEATTQPPVFDPRPAPRLHSARRRRSVSVGLLVPLLVGAAALGALGTRLWWPSVEVAPPAAGTGAGDGSTTDAVAPGTGQDIFDTGCVKDGIIITSDEREFATQFSVHLSYECNAVWARVYRYDGAELGNQIKVVISPRNDSSAGPAQEIVVKDANVAVTPMIVQNATEDQFCAEAWVTNGSDEWISLGDPICV
ncbi:helix-turn-helix domain-containing protein [Miniimonas arenae]|uniref:helix-turn-helix domain-containing protein n=1 Tax=Miniimonas arenae TaxID=676201 RepID=UPI0028AD1346|nr:helix-turn-helix transcriptional regulator [Miniimonas arenae]